MTRQKPTNLELYIIDAISNALSKDKLRLADELLIGLRLFIKDERDHKRLAELLLDIIDYHLIEKGGE